MARTHAANRFATTLTSNMGPTDLTAQVLTTQGAPVSPCYLVIDHDDPTKAEVILFDGAFTGASFVTTVLANRYLDGSAASSGITHASGANVISAPLGSNIEDIWDEIGRVGTAPEVEVFTSDGTYTTPANAAAVWVRVVGGGGSGGGTPATGSGEVAESSGGAGGGYAEKLIDSDDLGATETVTIGAGGAGASAGANDGNNGGDSSFGSHCSATGGGAGSGGTTSGVNASFGGSGISGDVNIGGDMGGNGMVIDATAVRANHGGGSVLGAAVSGNGGTGGAGGRYGGGSPGSGSFPNDQARGSSDGADGVVICVSYF